MGVPVVAQWLTNPTRNHEVAGSIPALAQWVNDLVLLWLWCRPAATAPIRPLAWEPPYALGADIKKFKNPIEQKNRSFSTPVCKVLGPWREDSCLNCCGGVPIVVQWKRIRLGTMRLQV